MKSLPVVFSPARELFARAKVTRALAAALLERKDRRRWVPALVAVCFMTLTAMEWRYAPIESRVLAQVDRSLTFWMEPGPSSEMERPGDGPYDQRLGISNLRDLTTHLENNGYEITAQAHSSPLARALSNIGMRGIFHEKTQAGLRIEDRNGVPLFEARYPDRIYTEYRTIPPLVVSTLLYIENRQLQDTSHPQQNPAVEWERMGKAVFDLGLHTVDRKHSISGGSTLATQLEKMRHSPAGRTGSVAEKVRQMAAASLRSYVDGVDTREARQQIVRDYLNSIPLAATPAQGEVFGLGDGLGAWYGADFDRVNEVLFVDDGRLNQTLSLERARAYREVLSLFLAMRAPGWYLMRRQDELKTQIDRYLRALATDGIISTSLRDLALSVPLDPRPDQAEPETASFISNKAPNAIRSSLLPLLGLDNNYALDRLDLGVKTTLDKQAQDSTAEFLRSLSDRSKVAASALNQYQLLDSGNPESVIYSVTLYEQTAGVNELRIQTDNFDQPLDINQGTRLQLGSTAKLRTLIHYLEIVSALHDQYAATPMDKLKSVSVSPSDALTTWAISYLSTATNKSLEPMLEAALQRQYSGSPDEPFFTAGGLQTFANFEKSEDFEVMTVSEAFERSVNLVFIRLLRDIEHYHRYRVPGASPDVLTNPQNPARAKYLSKFADLEGKEFLQRFYEKYRNQTSDQALNTLVKSVILTTLRAAVIYRSVRPDEGRDKFDAFLKSHLIPEQLATANFADLYAKYGPDKFNLQDRGYLARTHPLELWLMNYREHHPAATLAEIYANSTNERQQAYKWLLTLKYPHGQDTRIETVMESESFAEIHRAWQRLGYPFDSLVPSYATAIGVSGDTPAALAKLVGIILSGGVSYPTERIQQLHFGPGTPSETILARHVDTGEQVLLPQIARIVRREMLRVVQNGTGRRAAGGIELPNGKVLPIGGKTGTGDNQFHIYAKDGGLLASHTVNRTAAFAFFIGDRFFGTVLAFVPGEKASGYDFTSALAVQVLKDLTPTLMPMLEDTRNRRNASATR
jgi:membrane peptidoglycan carboxypeptidase